MLDEDAWIEALQKAPANDRLGRPASQ